ncbi:hypothetical protein [Paraburkholderia solisilvae]|uniref:Iron-containing redox enzyme family protein n=1 Tax=Paraburkholderia solisilvae TaxID=624376 RepID=A0A6J5DFA5_9BURK|nr:hypothetical protein [Paraburkholderia solisilvae]CAB3751842.1 hypothetical protein LMG29739_01395 [Paraburkholderia solisilvae]
MSNADRERFELVAAQAIEKMFAASPVTAAFHRGEWIDREYYRRHLVETVLRIRLNNEVDAFALYRIGFKDNPIAQILAQYLAEEYGHEGLFLRDIEKFGLTESQVNAIQPFHCTDKLIGFLYLSIGRDGPLPTMVWNWLVEWYSDRYNKTITEAAAQAFGHDLVKGSLGHIHYDESHNHDDLMWSAVQRAIDNWGGVARAEVYLSHFVGLIGEYFDELLQATAPELKKAAA